MNLNFAQFMDSIPYLLKGMLGIFVVTAVIVLVVLILNAVSKRAAKK